MWVVLVRTVLRLIFVLREVPCHVDHDFISVDELHKGLLLRVLNPRGFHYNSSFIFQVRMNGLY